MSKLSEFGSRVLNLHTGEQGLRTGVVCEVKDVTGAEPVMDFIASTSAVDRYNEVIDQNGWDLTKFLTNPVIPDCHDYSSVGRILGRSLQTKVIAGKLTNRVEFNVDNPLGLMAYKMAQKGFLKAQSVGFIPLEWKNGTGNDPDRTYTKAELLEISMVVVPANPDATIGLALKSGAIGRDDVRKALDHLQQFCSLNDPNAEVSASGVGVDYAHLQSSKALSDVLKAYNK